LSAAWPRRVEAPGLPQGEIHFWRANLDSLVQDVVSLRPLLAPDELERARRFHFERDAARYIVGRGVLRMLVASYQRTQDARAIVFCYGTHGKPSLADDSRSALRFNLAHTAGFALWAFMVNEEVGVDVERVHHLPDMDAVMRSSFAPAERTAIASIVAVEDRHRAFFRCWTRKEAVLKALGWGLAKPLDSFEVSFDRDNPRMVSMVDEVDAAHRWQLQHIEPAPGFVGAAAWKGDSRGSRYFTYER
jgi:4'-phosphopantetheinyl transferase